MLSIDAHQYNPIRRPSAMTELLQITPAPDDLHKIVRDHYAAAAVAATQSSRSSCCGTGCCDQVPSDPISSRLYDESELAGLPEQAILASLGCGNPTALAELSAGEVVLDLGSGGGIDVLLSARRVGPTGFAYGLDMTDEMLDLARSNAGAAGATNVDFRKGTIEAIPLPDESVDVIISNCVINLAADKDAVLAEAFRVLRPGGRFAVSDLVMRRDLPAELRRSMELWAGCIAGALPEQEFLSKLEIAGFTQASIEPTRVYTIDDIRMVLTDAGLPESLAPSAEGAFASAFIRATKPARG
jgi:SAM-dependent methyltransferase